MRATLLAAALSVSLLTGCGVGTPNLIEHVPTVIEPDRTLYPCPTVSVWPNVDSLTDLDVANLLITLRVDELTCKNSITSVFQFLDEAKDKTSR